MSPERRFQILLVSAVLVGAAIRLFLIIKSGWLIDYDEAMLGLTGFQVMRGGWPLHVPGQSTLGSLEAYLLSALFWIGGKNVVSLRLLSLIYSGLYVITVGLIARYAFDQRVGALAALFAALAPAYMLVTGMKMWAGTIEIILLGNCLLLAVFFTIEKSTAPRQRWFGLSLIGFIAGMSFWTAWSCFYYGLPAGLILWWKGPRSTLKGLAFAAIAFFIGSLPFWIYNVTSGFATFVTLHSANPVSLEQTGLILAHYWNDLMPRMISGDPKWHAIGSIELIPLLIIYYVGQVALWFWLFAGRWRGQEGFSLRMILAGLVFSIPLIYVASSYGINALNPWTLDATGRYVLMMHTALPIGAASLIVSISSRADSLNRGQVSLLLKNAIALVIAGSLLTLNLIGAINMDTFAAFNSPYYDRSQRDLEPLISYLDEQQIDHVWVDTAIGNILMFATQERIVTGDYYDTVIAGGPNRTPDKLEAVYQAHTTAYVIVVQPGQQDPPLQQALDALGVTYLFKADTPTLYVYTPSRRVDPEEIRMGLGYQYWVQSPAK